jgi:hypothetical protein
VSPLDLLPPGGRLVIIAAAVASLLGLYAWRVHVERDVGRAEIQLQWHADVSRQRAEAVAQAEANAKETQRRLGRQQEATNAHEKALELARADAAAGADSVARLRQRIAQLAAAPSATAGNSAPASVSTPAASLGDVAGRCVGALAQLRDGARLGYLAGLECQQRYDALGAGAQGAVK